MILHDYIWMFFPYFSFSSFSLAICLFVFLFFSDLSMNRISEIEPKAFAGADNLRTL